MDRKKVRPPMLDERLIQIPGVGAWREKEFGRRGLGLNMLRALLNSDNLDDQRRDEILARITEMQSRNGDNLFGTD